MGIYSAVLVVICWRVMFFLDSLCHEHGLTDLSPKKHPVFHSHRKWAIFPNRIEQIFLISFSWSGKWIFFSYRLFFFMAPLQDHNHSPNKLCRGRGPQLSSPVAVSPGRWRSASLILMQVKSVITHSPPASYSSFPGSHRKCGAKPRI